MCDVLSGVPGCVTKCDMGRGSKLAKNSVTYFMDGPQINLSVERKKSLKEEHFQVRFVVRKFTNK